MPNWNMVVNLLTLAFLGVGGWLLLMSKTALETTVTKSTEEVIRNLTWQKELARELQKTRGLARQELRFKSYGALWKELRPLAIYDEKTIDRETADSLLKSLSDWYFSECGGLLLTPQARGFYFALQDLLRIASNSRSEWCAVRSKELEANQDLTFRELLNARNLNDAVHVLDNIDECSLEDWPNKSIELGEKWRKSVKQLGAVWSDLGDRERFAVLQQFGSKLRSSLANDLESRER